MEVSFFEEFPSAANLDKLRLINFPAKVYIAAHSLNEFRKFERLVRTIHNGGRPEIRLVYWIVLKKWEGYWISPFSMRSALMRTLNEVRNVDIEVMLDLEHPVHAPWLYVGELPNFSRNKRFIQEFVDSAKPNITLVELSGDEERLKFWGLAYDSPDRVGIAKMFYTSLKSGSRKKKIESLARMCELGVKKYGTRFKIGLGCIAKGISGIEPILSAKELEEDLQIAKESGVSSAIIFRLGGLTPAYVEAIERGMMKVEG